MIKREHYWKGDMACYDVSIAVNIKVYELMQSSMVFICPFRYWFIAIHLLTSTISKEPIIDSDHSTSYDKSSNSLVEVKNLPQPKKSGKLFHSS
jgi:hypothetical protein